MCWFLFVEAVLPIQLEVPEDRAREHGLGAALMQLGERGVSPLVR